MAPPDITWEHARTALLSEIDRCSVSFRDSGAAPPWHEDGSWLMCGVAALLFCLGAAFDERDQTGSLAAAAAATAAATGATAVVVHRMHRSEHYELIQRLEDVAERFRSASSGEPLRTAHEGSHGAAHAPSLRHPLGVLAFRAQQWQRIPALLLVQGDIVALAAGDSAPGDVECIRPARTSHGARASLATLRRGERVCLSSPSHHSMKRSQQLPRDSDAFLSLCGDLNCYRMLETPLREFLAERVPRRHRPPEPRIRSQLDALHRALSWARFGLLGIVVLLGAGRAFLAAERGLWSFYLLTRPAVMLLALSFPVLPVLEGFVEAIVTAQLLTVLDRLDHHHHHHHRRRRRRRRQRRQHQHQHQHNHTWGRGDQNRSVAQRLWPFMHRFKAVCAHRLGMRRIATLQVPLRMTHLAERLGAVTMLCVVDGDVVCEPFAVAEEIFFLKSSQGTVLDLYSTTSADGRSSLRFEDPLWWKHLPSLKPVGLSCLATANRPTNKAPMLAEGIEGMNATPKTAESSHEMPSTSPWLVDRELGPNAVAETKPTRSAATSTPAKVLIEYVRQRPPSEDHFEKLARVVGFGLEDMRTFREKLRVYLTAPHLSDILHTQDINVLSQKDLWRRGSLQPHLTAVVVDDNRSANLQLLCKGDPKVAIGGCIDYWDGGNISPLTEQDRQAIMDIYQRWTLEDMDVSAFSYTPMPHMAEALFRVPQIEPMFLIETAPLSLENDQGESSAPSRREDANEATAAVQFDHEGQNGRKSALDVNPADINNHEAATEPTEREAVMWSLLREQVFLGMVASRIPLKPGVQEDIDNIMKAGVRFVFFSPRNMRRSKSLAEKMGIETDWNCAISLRAQDVDTAPDWMAKARLPHGVDAIRKHIEEVDNVPLLVSLYTDATPKPTKDMFEVFQENAESVLCLGSSHTTSNANLFEVADLSFSAQSSPSGSISAGEKVLFPNRLSFADVTFNESLIGLSCALTLPNDPDGGRGHALTNNVLVLIQEGRRLLMNTCQLMAFSVSVSSTLAMVALLCHIVPVSSPPSIDGVDVLWVQLILLIFVTLPMLAFPAHPSVLTQTSCKNTRGDVDSASVKKRCALFLAARTVPTALVCIAVDLWAFGAYMVTVEPEEAASCSSSDREAKWWDLLWCSGMESGRLRIAVESAHQSAQALATFALVLTLSVQSVGYAYRTQSLHQSLRSISPLANRWWLAGVIIVIVVQGLHSTARAGLIKGRGSISWVPLELWSLILVWPFLNLLIGEIVKADDARTHERYLKFLQLEFSTRLGMYSPR